MEHYSAIRKEWTIDVHKLDGSLGNNAEWKKKILKDYILWLHLHNILKWQNFINGLQISGYQRLRMSVGDWDENRYDYMQVLN